MDCFARKATYHFYQIVYFLLYIERFFRCLCMVNFSVQGVKPVNCLIRRLGLAEQPNSLLAVNRQVRKHLSVLSQLSYSNDLPMDRDVLSQDRNSMVIRVVTCTRAIPYWKGHWLEKRTQSKQPPWPSIKEWFTHLLHSVGVCHYINVYVQYITKLLPAKDPITLVLPLQQWPTCHTCLTYSFYFSDSFSEFFPKGRLTEQGSIQPEGTVSGRRSLTSCCTLGRKYQLPILFYHTITQPASKYTLYVRFQFSPCCIFYTKWIVILNIVGQEFKPSSEKTIPGWYKT